MSVAREHQYRTRVVWSGVGRAGARHDKARTECFVANSVSFPVDHEPSVRRAGEDRA